MMAAYAPFTDEEIETFRPRIALVDETNTITERFP